MVIIEIEILMIKRNSSDYDKKNTIMMSNNVVKDIGSHNSDNSNL